MKTFARNTVLSAGFQSQTRTLREVQHLPCFYTHLKHKHKIIVILDIWHRKQKIWHYLKALTSCRPDPWPLCHLCSPEPRTWPSSSLGEGRAAAPLKIPLFR